MTPQEKLVIDYIKQRGSITQREASADLGIDRLASRISDLRKGGVDIFREWEYGMNRRGEKCHWARYRMGGKA
jgi:predicted XRE-type DNA-binding protein